jgi:hypothetical protein
MENEMTKDEVKYTWEVRGLKTQDANNTVVEANCFVLADYVDGEYDADVLPTRVVLSQENSVSIPFNENESFVEYGNLTEDYVLSWVFNIIDKEEIEQNLFVDLKAKYEERILNFPDTNNNIALPW